MILSLRDRLKVGNFVYQSLIIIDNLGVSKQCLILKVNQSKDKYISLKLSGGEEGTR